MLAQDVGGCILESEGCEMNVRDILEKVQDIDALIHVWRNGDLKSEHFDDIMDLLIEYKEELLKKKVV